MIWFFKRGVEKLQCEVRTALDGDGYELVVTQPDGTPQIERYPDLAGVLRRQHELDRAWRAQGWEEQS